MFTLLASDSFVSKKSVNTYPICDSPLWRLARRSFAPSVTDIAPKSSTHLSDVLTLSPTRADISRRYHLFTCEMTSEKRAQKFHTDNASLRKH